MDLIEFDMYCRYVLYLCHSVCSLSFIPYMPDGCRCCGWLLLLRLAAVAAAVAAAAAVAPALVMRESRVHGNVYTNTGSCERLTGLGGKEIIIWEPKTKKNVGGTNDSFLFFSYGCDLISQCKQLIKVIHDLGILFSGGGFIHVSCRAVYDFRNAQPLLIDVWEIVYAHRD